MTSTSSPQQAWLPHAMLVLSMALMASNVVIGRAVALEMPPAGFTMWRCTAAALLTAPFAWYALRRDLPTLVTHWRHILAMGFAWAVAGHAFTYTALQTTTAINAALISSTQPALTVLVAWFVLRNPVGVRQVVGLVAALVGVVVIIVRGEFAAIVDLRFVIGDLFVLLSMASFAAYNVLAKTAPPGLHPFALLVAIMAAGAALLVPVHVVELLTTDLRMHASFFTAWTVGYTSIFATIFAVVLWNVGVQRLGPSGASMFINLVPVFATALAVFFLREEVAFYHGAGVSLIVGGVYVATRARAA
ncbi:MAG: DMT family transporter [Alphaproteobacteria bacterium]|nr:DMT family transporter [Alphaproteobacteria bacterium]